MRYSSSRRDFVQALLAFSGAGAAGFLGTSSARAAWPPDAPRSHDPTPECDDGDDPTPPLTAGPYFKADSPERGSLIEPGVTGTALALSGRVLTPAGLPIAGALVDFWQADDRGAYDTSGYRLRGHQYTDRVGRFTLSTVVPGPYPGRTRHLHVRAQAPKGPILTTQLYFPGEPGNERDRLYRSVLQMDLRREPRGQSGTFDFVLRPAARPDPNRYNV